MKTRMLAWMLLCLLPLPGLAQDLLTQFKEFTDSHRALSVGLATWTDKEHDLTMAGYFNFAFLAWYDDHVRLGAGMAGGWNNESSTPLMRFQTSVTTRIFDSVEVGAWWAPFWNTGADKDDPYGLMVGYVFKF